jgi:hypothetical protein
MMVRDNVMMVQDNVRIVRGIYLMGGDVLDNPK